MEEHFEYFSNQNNTYYFRLKAKNGKIILASQWYTDKWGCLNGIESVKENANSRNNFENRNASDKSYYFVLKAGNGQIIGTSQMYTTLQSCNQWISSVMTNAPLADSIEVDI